MPDDQTSSRSRAGARMLDKVRVFARAGLTAQQAVGEQLRVVAETLRTNAVPAFYMLETPDTPQERFTVWRGAETMTDELRMLIAAGIWPGPPEAPSPAELVARRQRRTAVAVQLWGTPNDGPWSPLWRERNVRHGLYGAFFSDGGRIGVMLCSRGNDGAPFDARDTAFVNACAPYVERALDLPMTQSSGPLTPEGGVFVRFDADGSLAAMGFGGREVLRDVGGGGPGAVERATAALEAANARVSGRQALDDADRAAFLLAGGASERGFRESLAELHSRAVDDPDRTGAAVVVAETASGRHVLRVSTLIGRDGALERMGRLVRFVPPLLLRLRGAQLAGASGRELQLLCALDSHQSLAGAASALNVTRATARTLGERLARRVGANALGDALDTLIEAGREALG